MSNTKKVLIGAGVLILLVVLFGTDTVKGWIEWLATEGVGQ